VEVDSTHPILAWKASKDLLRPGWFTKDLQERFPAGLPKISSVHGEDALTWNVFRTLQLANRIDCLTDTFMPGLDGNKVYFWGHDADQQSEEIDSEIQYVLDEMEPWGKGGVKQQTEPDVIARGKHHVVVVECKLGKPGQKVRAWQRSRIGMPPEYANFLAERELRLFAGTFKYERDGNRFYQLFRNYVLGAALRSRWNTDFSLVAIVNSMNSNVGGKSHEREFNSFRFLLTNFSNTHIISWQQICNVIPKEKNLLSLRSYLVDHPLLNLPR
jgi:hypothetical protein